MAEMTIRGAVQNTRNNVTDTDGYALPPLAANLKEGQIAVNTCETDPCIFFKTSEGKIVKIVSEEKLTKALTDILGNSAADLDTLRELIALFEGSANDILPMLTALTDRVTAAETSLTNKADKSALNAHTGNTSNPHSVTKAQVGLSNVDNTADSAKPVSTAQATAIADAKKAGTDAQTSLTSHVDNKANPHGVTKAQVGLSNVLNKEQLGKDEVAVEANKLSRVFLNDVSVDDYFNNTIYVLGSNVAGTPLTTSTQGSKMFAIRWDDNAGSQMFFEHATDDVHIRRKSSTWQPWRRLYHSGNANRLTVNWAADTMNANRFIGTDLALSGNAVIQNNQVYHAGNCNNNTTDWTARNTYTREVISHSVTNAVGNNFDVKASNGNGTDKYGGDTYIWAGAGTGNARGGSIRFRTASAGGTSSTTLNTFAERMVISHNGYVGIGTTTPSEILDVVGNIGCTSILSRTYKGTNTPINTNGKPTDIEGSRGNGTDRAGGGLYLYGGHSTGNASGGVIGFFTTPAGSATGSVNNKGVRRMTITSTGNVGIGTESPIDKLHISGGGITISNGSAYRIQDSTGRAVRISSLDTVNDLYIGCLDSGLKDLYIKHNTHNTVRFSGTNPNGTICVSDGKIGFGTNNPTDRVHAVGNVRATEKVIAGGNVESNGSGIFAGDIIAKKTGAVVFSTSDAAAGATRLNDLIDVKLPTNLADKMVLAYDPAQVNSDGSKGGYTFMPSAGTGTGTVSSAEITSLPDHNHNDIVYASDERLKENVIPLRNATIMLNNLRPKEYNWNETGKKLGLRDPKAYGLIAQEVEGLREIIDLVKPMHGGESGYLGVDYVKLVPVLIAGFQEQHKEIIALNQKLKTIQARANKAYGNETNNADKIAQLEAEIAELKMLIKK